VATLDRLTVIAHQFDFSALRYQRDDSKGPRRPRDPHHYRHKETGVQLETKIVNFWTFKDGWPGGLTEITTSGACSSSAPT
jgi:hypothetical protein